MKFLVLVNEAARGLARTDRKELSVRLLRGFNAAGAQAYIHCIDAPSLLREAKEAASSDFDAVIIGGGDGLVAEVLNHVAATRKPIGVLPLGIHNHFARQLKVPLDLDRAVTALARGEIGDAPAAEVNGRIFLNFAAVGLPDTRGGVNHNESWPAMFKRAVHLNDRALRVRSRGHTLARDATAVIACNNLHAMDMFELSASPVPESGLLNVYVAGASRRVRGPVGRVLRRVGMKIWNGVAPPRFETMALPELRIESARKQLEVSIDGDIWAMHPPLTIQLRERALRVLLPGDPTAPTPAPVRPSVEVTTHVDSHVDGLELEPEPRDTAHS